MTRKRTRDVLDMSRSPGAIRKIFGREGPNAGQTS